MYGINRTSYYYVSVQFTPTIFVFNYHLVIHNTKMVCHSPNKDEPRPPIRKYALTAST